MAKTRDNQEFGQFARRIVRAYGRRAGAGDITTLSELVRLRETIDRAMDDAALALRRDHMASYAELGRELGITRQAAAKRWPTPGVGRRVGGQPGNLR